MPQTPEDLSRTIKEIAGKIAKNKGRGIKSDALDRIGRLPADYSILKTIDVNLERLEYMIDDIMEFAILNTSIGAIDLNAMEKALIEVKCHYLWFC